MNDSDEWFEQHRAYLATSEWQAKRELVLARDHRVCQASLEDCTGLATEVHHTTYRHWRNEPLFDLVSVCQSCHARITYLERRERAERMLEAYAKSAAPVIVRATNNGMPDLNRYKWLLAHRDPATLNASERESYEIIKMWVAGVSA